MAKDSEAPRKVSTFRIEQELLDGMKTLWDRDGIAMSEQVRRALRAWLESKGIVVKSERKRASTRKRP